MKKESKTELSSIINELGEDRQFYFNAIAPPIVQTSNFAFETVDELRNAFEDEMGSFLYTRGMNPTVDILRKKLAALDEAEDCLVFNCGAAAIFAAVLANVKAGDHIVSVKEPYTWARKMFEVILPRFGVTTSFVDGKDISCWEESSKSNTSLYYLESPNSWDYAIQPLQEIARLAKDRGIITVIDNSYCTPLYQKPIPLGIDLSLQTATKYIGGHSDTLGGVLCGSAEMMRKIFESEYLNIGSGIQPFNAWLLLRGLRTLPLRLEKISETSREVIAFLKSHPKVESVLFPFDESFPQFELAQQQMQGACGLMTIELKADNVATITNFCEQLQHFKMAVSWGGHESLVLPKCAGFPASEFNPGNPEHRYIRLYTGLEEARYLIADLQQALDRL